MRQHANGHRPTCNAWVQLGGLRFTCRRPRLWAFGARQGTRAHRHHWYVKWLKPGGAITISWDEQT